MSPFHYNLCVLRRYRVVFNGSLENYQTGYNILPERKLGVRYDRVTLVSIRPR
nr:MAG TPA: hypothetical protein [Caudoviricetes sp.]